MKSMKNHEKRKILALRKKGMTYAKIGKKLGIPMNTVKSVCRRAKATAGLCRNCGTHITQTPKRKPRIFCSNACRDYWWKHHRDYTKQKALYRLTCKGCRKDFNSYGHKNRKYCSHKCYINYRFYSVIESKVE